MILRFLESQQVIGNIKSYVLLYVNYSYIYAYVTTHVCYLWY